jgi:acid phosphatase
LSTHPPTPRRFPFLLVLLLGIALGAGGMGAWQRWRHVPAPPLNPQERALDANLYMQTAAEYRACCLQAYRLATDRLHARAGQISRPAVVLDLDETVLDNSPFQTFLYRYGLNFSDALWDDWEKNHPDEVRLVPGAKDFIAAAEKAGVTVFFVSNRSEKYRASTVAALTRLGLNVANIEQRLFLQTDTSDKTARFKRTKGTHNVVLFLGDNLRDFSNEFAAPPLDKDDPDAQNRAIARRYDQVDKHRARWGDDWIILPNPVYGEWQRLPGNRPLDNLRPSTMQPPAAPTK